MGYRIVLLCSWNGKQLRSLWVTVSAGQLICIWNCSIKTSVFFCSPELLGSWSIVQFCICNNLCFLDFSHSRKSLPSPRHLEEGICSCSIKCDISTMSHSSGKPQQVTTTTVAMSRHFLWKCEHSTKTIYLSLLPYFSLTSSGLPFLPFCRWLKKLFMLGW